MPVTKDILLFIFNHEVSKGGQGGNGSDDGDGGSGGGDGDGVAVGGGTSQQQFSLIANFEPTTNNLFLYRYNGLTIDYPLSTYANLYF
jgi:hypothetical protein